MEHIAAVLELINNKHQLFADYLKATSAMMGCDTDDLAGYVQTRGELAQQIDQLDSRLKELCAGEPLLAAAVKNKCDRGDLPSQLLPVFDAAQSLFGVINQVANLEPQVILRMQDIQKDLEILIKASNKKPKIAKYLDAHDPTLERGFLMRSSKA